MNSDYLSEIFSPNQIEFISEDELIQIIPKKHFPELFLISGNCGPFKPGIPIHIPLWLAITLKKKNKCRIIPPPWLKKEYLEEVVKTENESDLLTELPFHFLPIAYQLLHISSDDFHDETHVIRTLLEDILGVRQAKIRQSLLATTVQSESSSHFVVKMKNFTLLELNTVRDLAQHAVNTIHDYGMIKEESRAAREAFHQNVQFEDTSREPTFSNRRNLRRHLT